MQGFFFGRGDNQFADALMRDPARGTVVIQKMTPLNAQLGFETAGWIVNACVNHFRVASASACADPFGGFHHHDFAAGEGELSCDRQTNHAGADNNAINICTHDLTGVRS